MLHCFFLQWYVCYSFSYQSTPLTVIIGRYAFIVFHGLKPFCWLFATAARLGPVDCTLWLTSWWGAFQHQWLTNLRTVHWWLKKWRKFVLNCRYKQANKQENLLALNFQLTDLAMCWTTFREDCKQVVKHAPWGRPPYAPASTQKFNLAARYYIWLTHLGYVGLLSYGQRSP